MYESSGLVTKLFTPSPIFLLFQQEVWKVFLFFIFLFCFQHEQTAHSSVILFWYQMLNFFESSTFHHSITKTKDKSFICCILFLDKNVMFGLFFILFSHLSTVSNNLNNYNSLKVKPKNFSNKSWTLNFAGFIILEIILLFHFLNKKLIKFTCSCCVFKKNLNWIWRPVFQAVYLQGVRMHTSMTLTNTNRMQN